MVGVRSEPHLGLQDGELGNGKGSEVPGGSPGHFPAFEELAPGPERGALVCREGSETWVPRADRWGELQRMGTPGLGGKLSFLRMLEERPSFSCNTY